MPLRHITLVLALAITQILTAAEVRLGAETPITSAVEPSPAFSDQTSPSVASNGNDFLAVWADHREGGMQPSVYASRLGPDGRPLQPFGQKLAQIGNAPHVASDGRDYVIVYHDDVQSYSIHVDENGQPLGQARALQGGRIPVALASNGSNYLLLEIDRNSPEGNRPVLATLLDRNGARLQALGQTFDILLWLGVRNGTYVLLDVHSRTCNNCITVTLHEISDSGTVTSTAMPAINVTQAVFVSAVASEDRVLVAWDPHSSLSTADYMVFDHDGNVVKPETTMLGPVNNVLTAWDGAEFLLVWGSDATTKAQRLSPNGAVIDAQPFTLPSGLTRQGFGSNGSRQILVWSDRSLSFFLDVFSRVVTNFAELATTPGVVNLVSLSGTAHLGVQLASGAGGVLAVWDDSNGAIEGFLNGQPVSIMPDGTHEASNVVVAAGKENFLVAWVQTELNGSWRLFARRVRLADGRLLDAQPIPIFEGPAGSFPIDRADLSYDGSRFLLTWVSGDHVHMTLLNDAGLVLNHRSIVDTSFFTSFGTSRGVWSGTQFFTAYSLARLVTDVGPLRWSIGLEAADATGTDNNTPLPAALPEIANAQNLAFDVAAGPTRLTFAWAEDTGIVSEMRVAQTTLSGQPLGEPQRVNVPLDGRVFFTELVWNGSEYVLVWTEFRFGTSWSVRAVRLDAFGVSKDAVPIEIAEVRPFSAPAVTVLPNGVMIGFLRMDTLQGNVFRAYTRTLERLPGQPSRRRAVRQ